MLSDLASTPLLDIDLFEESVSLVLLFLASPENGAIPCVISYT